MNTTMRAAVLESARTIKVQPRSTPELKPGMVLLRVRRAGICGSDLHYFDHGCCGAFVPTRPFVLGHEFAAEVTAIGEGVTNVQVGARVTANPADPNSAHAARRNARSIDGTRRPPPTSQARPRIVSNRIVCSTAY